MAVPNIFGSATAAIPLSQLDTNFATPVTIGNTAVQLGNTVTSFGNVTLTNVTISSGNVTITGANVSGTANVSTLIITGNQTSLGNVSITGNVSANIATFGAGSNTAPAITTTGDTNTGIFFPAADTIAFSEGGVESMRIDSSGNLGIGITTPAAKLQVAGGRTFLGANSELFSLGLQYNSSTGQYYLGATNSATPDLVFSQVGGTERMRLTNSGNVGIGTGAITQLFANYTQLGIKGGTTTAGGTLQFVNSAGTIITNLVSDTNATYIAAVGGGGLAFSVGGSGTGTERGRFDGSGNLLVGTTTTPTSGHGTIGVQGAGTYYSFGSQTNGSTSFVVLNGAGTGVFLTNGGTSWTGLSDERLKTNITPFENAIQKITSLRSGTGRFLTDNEDVSRSFLIAQDVQKVLPEAVNILDTETGYLGLQYTDIIPLLVAGIQEQQALILSLTARITALETK